MTETATDILAALDFEATVPCEGYGHDDVHVPRGAAKWIQHGTCPVCFRPPPQLALCDGGRLYRLMCDRVICSGCGTPSPTPMWHFTFTPIEGES